MSADLLYTYANNLALLAWILLAVVPRWKFTKWIVRSGIISLLFALMYLIIFLRNAGEFDFQAFNDLNGVMELFQSPTFVVMGWIHYLAFDLFVGLWEVSDAEKKGIPHLWVVPCLFFTLMLGPIGLLLYFLIRTIYQKNIRPGVV